MSFMFSYFDCKCRNEPVNLSIPIEDSIILFRDDIDLTSISRCGYCGDLYSKHDKSAITVPCGHTFCKQCIKAAMTPRKIIMCPDPECNATVCMPFYQKNLALTYLLEKLNFLDEPSNQHIIGESDDDIIVLRKDDDSLFQFAECCICLERYTEGDHAPITTVCGHTFCDLCAESISEQYKCPVCRTEFGKMITLHDKDMILIKTLKKLQLFDRGDAIAVEKEAKRFTIKTANKQELSSKNENMPYFIVFGMVAGLSLIAFGYSRRD